MKPSWNHTLAWIAAVIAAFLLAFLAPDSADWRVDEPVWPQGATAPR